MARGVVASPGCEQKEGAKSDEGGSDGRGAKRVPPGVHTSPGDRGDRGGRSGSARASSGERLARELLAARGLPLDDDFVPDRLVPDGRERLVQRFATES